MKSNKFSRSKKGPKQGYYKLQHPEKFRAPVDAYMQSTKIIEGNLCIQYKSGLELKAFKYCDNNPKIKEFSLEPFHIPYLSPVDGKFHRYFPDIWLKFTTGDIFIIEIKPHAETKMPRKNDKRYSAKLNTYLINQAKWEAARNFAKAKGCNFMILTEKVLN